MSSKNLSAQGPTAGIAIAIGSDERSKVNYEVGIVFAGLFGTCISTTGTVFGLFAGSAEPGGGIGGGELGNVSILAVRARCSKIATAPFSCIACSIS